MDNTFHDSNPDEPHHDKPRDLSFYLTLIFVVAPIYAVIPLSWLYLLHCLYYGAWWSYTLKGYVFLTFACAEVSQFRCVLLHPLYSVASRSYSVYIIISLLAK